MLSFKRFYVALQLSTVQSDNHSAEWQSQCRVTITVQSDNHSAEWQSQCRVTITVQSDNHSAEWQSQCRVTITVQSDNQSAEWQSQCRVTIKLQSDNQNAEWQSQCRVIIKTHENLWYHQQFKLYGVGTCKLLCKEEMQWKTWFVVTRTNNQWKDAYRNNMAKHFAEYHIWK